MERGISSWSQWFELEVLKTIFKACSGNEKLVINKGKELAKFNADAYLPMGCEKLKIPAKTYIEVKFKLNTDTIWKWNVKIERTFGDNKNQYNFRMITYRPVSSGEMLTIGSEESTVKVISFEALKSRLQASQIQNRDTYTADSGGPITPIDNASNTDEKRDDNDKEDNGSESTDILVQRSNKKKSQEELFEQLHNDLKAEEKVTLFLGAGVSIAAGLPSWEGILENLLEEAGTKGNYADLLNSKTYSAIAYNCNHSPLILGRYIRCGAGLNPLIWGAVLKDLPNNEINQSNMSAQPDSSPWEAIAQNQREFNRMLHDALYKGYGNGNMAPHSLLKCLSIWIQQNMVSSVITYNYDDCLEEQLEKDGIPVHSIGDGTRPLRGKFPIYHVHGFLPRNNTNVTLPNPVLSEESYHELYREVYQWSNVEQLHAMNNTVCVFIGLSMTDPNLRRLLEFSYSQGEEKEKPHYVFLRKSHFEYEEQVDDYGEKIWKSISTPEQDIGNSEIVEDMLGELGVNVIWYNEHDDLPVILNQLVDGI